jgi:GH24 family phage-related lysozyme (muramidase)
MIRKLFSRIRAAGRAADVRPYVKETAKTSHEVPVMSKKPPIIDMTAVPEREVLSEKRAQIADNLPSGIKAANEAINALPQITHPPRNISQAGIDLLHEFEGCARKRPDGLVEAYPDPGTGAEPWTIGWGSTRNGLHGFVNRNTVWTQRQCDERFADDLRRVYVPQVLKALDGSPVTQGQLDALVSFHYNTGAIARSTLLRKHRAGDYAGAANEFARWNRAGGRPMKGLSRRRAAEAALYRGGE